ncbi:tRNA U-34 5-methylaminomethyl-2-thiouridine biosynthesis protein, partial [Klebsiella pneumoniae]|nr:tRNA U-34 5-methylaminomethyl-2-thiouridine biosynthesis protein [Klebsiella pneumoniae]
AAIAVACAAGQGKRVAVVGVGGLSGSLFTKPIDPCDDRIVHTEEDAWNRQVLALIETGDVDVLREALPTYAAQARVDMGFKH